MGLKAERNSKNPKSSAQKAVRKLKPLKKRSYDNTQRERKSSQTQLAILKALVSLLAEKRGGEVQIDEVAARSGITSRTIFRFFKDKRSMLEAMDVYLLSYLQAGNEQLATMNYVDFAKNAFALFDRHADLTQAYVLSPFGQEARTLFRRKLNQSMIEKILLERKLKLTPPLKKRLALVTSLVNAKIWYDLRSDYAYSGEDMAEAIGWALKTLLDHCDDK